ncbi:MAG: L,D-transpeptidase family protein [Neomegalonema sp.]|nr:L,D-transpeptidase family protein [Neomegalonema sp.]
MNGRGVWDLVVGPNGGARFGGRRFVCSVGLRGATVKKREGDGATPAGAFQIESVLYRSDRGRAPRTALPLHRIAISDGWCDDPACAAYNTPVRLPYKGSTERMRRSDPLYDLVAVVDANRDPIFAGAGSAIFLHIQRRPRFPTLGCVAFSQTDLRWILERWRPRSRVIVLPPHAGLARSPKTADPTRTDVAPIAMAIA